MEVLALLSLLSFLLLLGVGVTVTKQVAGFMNQTDTVTVNDDEGITAGPSTILAAQPATLTTRTSNTAGSLTMTNATHGIITGQRVDLYWTGGRCYGAVVGTVAGSVVPIATVSGGSVLPAATTAITVGIPKSISFGLTGNNLTFLGLKASGSGNGYFVFNNGAADVYAQYVTTGRMYEWETNNPGVNPLAGATPTVVWMSHDVTGSAVADMQAVALTH
jgi:hypothetical protein